MNNSETRKKIPTTEKVKILAKAYMQLRLSAPHTYYTR